MSSTRTLQDAAGEHAAAEAHASAEEILRRIYALSLEGQRRAVEFLRKHPDPGLRACAKPIEDALILRRLTGEGQ